LTTARGNQLRRKDVMRYQLVKYRPSSVGGVNYVAVTSCYRCVDFMNFRLIRPVENQTHREGYRAETRRI